MPLDFIKFNLFRFYLSIFGFRKRALTNHPQGFYHIDAVSLNGVRQWIFIRSQNADNPVLLWLDDIPGIAEWNRVARFNKPLEECFVIVNWSRPELTRSDGKMMSRRCPPAKGIRETVAMSEWLISRFHQPKLFLAGRGCGSEIGLWAAAKRPDLFRACVGIAPQIPSIGKNELGKIFPATGKILDTSTARPDFLALPQKIHVPVYLLAGRAEPVSDPASTEHYFDRLEAPKKTFVWFENSGHTPCFEEADKFNRFMLDYVLQENHPAQG